jgi:Cu+-exporting ATPase
MGKGLAFIAMVNPTLSRWIQYVLTTIVVFWCGWPLLHRAVESLRTRQLNRFTLIGLGVLAAWGYSLGVLLFPSLATDCMAFCSKTTCHTRGQVSVPVGEQ